MSTRVKREEFLQQLQSVTPGLAQREIVEQSTCFIFQNGKVRTYNEEISCMQKIPVDLTGAVPAQPLLSILEKLSEDEVQVGATKEELIIVGQKRKAGIRMEKEIQLSFKDIEKPEEWKPLPAELAEGVELVQQCTSKDASFFSLTCIHLTPKWIEASDNYQAARYKIKLGVEKPTLVRRTSLSHITSLGMTKFSETDAWIHFSNGRGLILSCRRYLDEFPNLSTLLKIGEGEPTSLPKGLGEAADRAEVFTSSEEENEVLVELRPGKLRIRGTGVSGWYQEVKQLKYNGEPMGFLIPPKLLAEISKQHNECTISEERLAVHGGRFTYVTALTRPEDSNGEAPEEAD